MKGISVFKIIGWVLLGVVLAVAVGALLGFGVMALWNWLMPEIFGLPEIDYWQAVGLFVLCHLLFKSHTAHHEKKGGHKHGAPDFVKAHLYSKIRRDEEADPEPAGESA
jgi:hypothetical protein